MSRSTQYFIEFKNPNTNRWTLFAPSVRLEDCVYPSVERDFFVPNNVSTHSEIKLITDSIQGYVRDVLDGNNDFNNRGFPEDMTSELVDYIKFIENKYKETIGWGKSYATLQELYDFVLTKKSMYEEYLKNYENMKSHNDIMDELHYLENLIINKNTENTDKPEEQNNESYTEYDEYIEEYKEQLEEIDGFLKFIISINRMVNFVYAYWYDMTDIRLIFYTD